MSVSLKLALRDPAPAAPLQPRAFDPQTTQRELNVFGVTVTQTPNP